MPNDQKNNPTPAVQPKPAYEPPKAEIIDFDVDYVHAALGSDNVRDVVPLTLSRPEAE